MKFSLQWLRISLSTDMSRYCSTLKIELMGSNETSEPIDKDQGLRILRKLQALCPTKTRFSSRNNDLFQRI